MPYMYGSDKLYQSTNSLFCRYHRPRTTTTGDRLGGSKHAQDLSQTNVERQVVVAQKPKQHERYRVYGLGPRTTIIENEQASLNAVPSILEQP